MIQNIETYTFPALLKSADDKLLEIGTANVSIENRSVDFHSEFVQLFKMETPLKIVIMKNDLEIQSFSGNVYLSSQNLLRLVDVTDQVLPGAKLACICEVKLAATAQADVRAFLRGPIGLFSKKIYFEQQSFVVNIYNISMKFVHFTTPKVIAKGQFIDLRIEGPAVHLMLEIRKSYEVGQALNNYHCIIKEIDSQSRSNLNRYVGKLCEEQFRLFDR